MTTARDIMSKRVVMVEDNISVADVAKIMDLKKVSSVIVTKSEAPNGIVSERDMLSKVTAKDKKPSEINITEVMSSPIVIITPMTPVEEIAEKMILNKIRHVVVSNDKKPIGIITVTDFVKHLHAMLSSSENYDKDLYQGLIEDWEHWTS